MASKLPFLIGLTGGYVLGTRAGAPSTKRLRLPPGVWWSLPPCAPAWIRLRLRFPTPSSARVKRSPTRWLSRLRSVYLAALGSPTPLPWPCPKPRCARSTERPTGTLTASKLSELPRSNTPLILPCAGPVHSGPAHAYLEAVHFVAVAVNQLAHLL